jgi:hypothetical protein
MQEVRPITSLIEPIGQSQVKITDTSESSVTDSFLDEVKRLIVLKGVKDVFLARMCGISAPFFSLIKSGKKNMPDHVREKLAEYFGL